MNNRKLLLLVALVAIPFAAPRIVAAAQPSVAPVVDDEDTPLQEAMQVLKGGQRSVKKLIKDPAANEAELLTTLASMESAILTALAEDAPHPDGMSGKDLALFNVGYKGGMVTLFQHVLALEEAALNQDADALKTAYDELSLQKKSGHEHFRDF